jgi:hypothetical protein
LSSMKFKVRVLCRCSIIESFEVCW